MPLCSKSAGNAPCTPLVCPYNDPPPLWRLPNSSRFRRPPGPYRGSVPCLTQNGAKSAEKIPALIVFGRIRSSNVNQSAVFIKKDAEAAKKAALDAGLSSFEVTTEEHQRAAAALPEGAIIAQRRFSLSPASSEIIGKAPPEGSRRALDGEVH